MMSLSIEIFNTVLLRDFMYKEAHICQWPKMTDDTVIAMISTGCK